eukprot:719543-Amphidinium_carterae.1
MAALLANDEMEPLLPPLHTEETPTLNRALLCFLRTPWHEYKTCASFPEIDLKQSTNETTLLGLYPALCKLQHIHQSVPCTPSLTKASHTLDSQSHGTGPEVEIQLGTQKESPQADQVLGNTVGGMVDCIAIPLSQILLEGFSSELCSLVLTAKILVALQVIQRLKRGKVELTLLFH